MKKLKMKLENKENVVIVGAGGAGRELFHELQKNFPKLSVIGFIDDFVKEKISKIPILGNVSEINKILSTHKVDTIFIAMPSSEGNLIKKIILESAKFSVKIKVIPRFSEIILNKASLNQLREIDVEDVIGRSINREMFNEISPNVKKNSFMVFGAAGSIGSKLCQQIASLSPKKLIMVDSNENGMFYLQEKINNILLDDSDSEKKKFSFYIGNIQDYFRMDQLVSKERPDIIINAAAYKHVPLMEENYYEAINNNVKGSKNLYDLAVKYNVRNFILISSDKAVNPTNIMGSTKRINEKMMYYYSSLNKSKTSFLAVRFGNVINSNGSVVKTFKKQIKKGGTITITHKDIIRYFMSIDEAVYLILQCWNLGSKDEIFVLDMGKPIKIVDLAKLMVKLSGLELGKDIKIEYVGLRPGEKLYEEPLTKIEETSATKFDKIFILKKEEDFDYEDFMIKVEDLIKYSGNLEVSEIKKLIKDLVPTYRGLNK